MQVKKFEAKSMKEALEMVKTQLGPEAVILSAKDHTGRWGIGGRSSVEITAAISAETLRKKLLAEQKLRPEDRQKFINSPARIQKKFIEKVDRKLNPEKPTPHQFTQRKYIDIDEEEEANVEENAQFVMPHHPPIEGRKVEDVLNENSRQLNLDFYEKGNPPPQAVEVRAQLPTNQQIVAVPQSYEMVSSQAKLMTSTLPSLNDRREFEGAKISAQTKKIENLQNEVMYLRKLLESFNKIPQTFINMHPGAEHGLSYELSSFFEQLTGVGISVENTVKLLTWVQEELPKPQLKKPAFIKAWLAKYFLENIEIAPESQERFHVFVGPTGSGKTSSLVKFASRLVVEKKKKIAVLTTDYKKVGAPEQLKIYAQILNVPFAVIRKPQDWLAVRDHLKHLDHILVDMPGLNLTSNEEFMQLNALMPPSDLGARVHYVQSLLASHEDVSRLTKRYQSIGFSDVILTKLDESSRHGEIINLAHEWKVALHSFGIGPHIPEDYERATKERVVDLIFKLTHRPIGERVS